MENKKILTISVAAYNLESMIEDNLKSFIECRHKEMLEVIITDDGSKDNTAKIVEQYVEEYPDIFKLVKQENTGAGSTVNSGIKNANGKFFKMIDGDDWIKPEDMDKLLERLSKSEADIVLTNTLIYNEKEKKIVRTEKPILNLNYDKVNCNFSEVCNNFVNMQMQFVTYKTSILQQNNIKLNNGFYTDVEYLLLPIIYVKSIDIYNLDIYVYRIAREGQSVSIASRKKNINMHDLVLKGLIKYYENKKANLIDNVKTYMAKRIAAMADMQLGTMLALNKNKNEIKEYNNYIQSESKEIYDIYSKKIKSKVIMKSSYILIKPLALVFKLKNRDQ